MKKEGYLITGDDIASMGLTLLPGKEHLKGKFALTKDEIINTYSADVSGISDNVTCVTYERVIPSIYLNLSKSAVNFLASGGSDAITIDTNAPSDQIKIEYDGNVFSYNLNDKTLNITAVSLESTEKAKFTDNLIVSVGSLTKTITINQEENKLVSVTATGTTSSGTIMNVSASGGAVTWTPVVQYTSGWSGTSPSGVSITYSITGEGATQSDNITTWANRGVVIGELRSASITISAKSSYTTTPITGNVTTEQNANTITAISIVNGSGGDPRTECPANGGISEVFPKFTFSSGDSKFSLEYSKLGEWSGSADGFTITTVEASASSGIDIKAASRGTVIGNSRSITVTYLLNTTINGVAINKSATHKYTQDGNYVTELSLAGLSISYSNILAGATASSAPSINSTGYIVTYKFTSGSSTTTRPTATFGGETTSRTYSLESVVNGFTAVNSSTGVLTATNRGTTIGNARTSGTVTLTNKVTWTPSSSYSAGGVKTATITRTATCAQNGNYVTSISVNGASFSYDSISAGATSASPKLVSANPYVTYAFSSGSTSQTHPSSTYGTFSDSVVYSLESAINGFTAVNSTSGVLTATNRGPSIGPARTSGNVIRKVTATWTPTSSYNAAGTKTDTDSKTATCTQALNTIESLVMMKGVSTPVVTSFTAAGGSEQYVMDAVYSSGARQQAVYNTITTYSFDQSWGTWAYNSSTNKYFGKLTVASRGTTIGAARTGTLIGKISGTMNGVSINKSVSVTITQALNKVTAVALAPSSGNSDTTNYPSGNFTATGGTKTPTLNCIQKLTLSSGSTYNTTGTGSFLGGTSSISRTWSMATASGFSMNTSNGAVTAASRGTTIGAARICNPKCVISGSFTNPSSVGSTVVNATSVTDSFTLTQELNTITALTMMSGINTPVTTSYTAAGGKNVYTMDATYSSGSRAQAGSNFASYIDYSFNQSWGTWTDSSSPYYGSLTVPSRGTTIGAARSGVLTGKLVGTINGVSINKSATATLTQALNKVISCTETGNTLSYPSIAAAGGTSTPSSTSTARFAYSSGATGDPSGYTMTKSFSMTAANGFSINTTSGVVTATNNTTTSSRTSNTITRTAKFSYTNPSTVGGDTVSATLTKTATCTQSAGVKTYANPVVSLSYATIPAKGGTVSPTISYSQTWGWNGATSGGGTVTSGATISYSGTSVNTTNGSVTAASKGTTISNITTVTTATATVKLNGKTGTKSATVSQQANEKYNEYNNLVGHIQSTSWGKNAFYASFWATGDYTEKYTSGATGASGTNKSIPWDSVTTSETWCRWNEVQGAIVYDGNTGLQRKATITGRIGSWTYSVEATQAAGLNVGKLTLRVPVSIGYAGYWNITVRSTANGQIYNGGVDTGMSTGNYLVMTEECAAIVALDPGTVSFSTTYSTGTDRRYSGSISGTEQDQLKQGTDITVYLS